MKENRIPTFYMVIMLYWSTMYTGNALISTYSQTLGATLTVIGLITGVYGLMQFLLRIPLGILSDKLGKRKPFITLSIAVATIGCVIMALAKAPIGMFVGRLFSGIAACAFVQIIVLYNSYGTNTGKATSMIVSVSTLGQMLAMFFGGLIADRYGVPSAFWLGAALGIVGIIASLFIKETPMKRHPLSFRDIRKISLSPGLIPSALLAIITQAVIFGKVHTFAPIAAKAMDVSELAISMVPAVSSMGIFLMSLIAAVFLSRKLEARLSIIIGFVIHGLACLLIVISGNIWMLYLSQLVSGVGQGLTFPRLMGISITHVPKEKQATAMGFFQAIYAIGMFLGPWIMGIIGDNFFLDTSFILVGVMAFFGALLAVFILKKQKI